jgi:hypothetical protein
VSAAAPTARATSPRLYRAFGLNILSELPFNDLRPGVGDADVRIERAIIDRTPPTPEQKVIAEFDDAEAYMAWWGVGRFLVKGPDLIQYQPAEQDADDFVSLPLLGPVISLLLDARDMFTLHGSSVEIGARAAIFVGDKGAGKSTTAATLVSKGRRLLTDDIVAFKREGDRHLVQPGYPQIKLTDTAAEAISIGDGTNLPTPHPDFQKQRVQLDALFRDAPIAPLGAFVLERGDAASVMRLRSVESVAALMRFSYMIRFGKRMQQPGREAALFRRCGELAKTTPVYRLIVPDTLDRIQEVSELLEQLADQPA